MIWDALAARFQELSYKWDADNPLSGRHPTILDLSQHKGAAEAVCAA